MNGSVCIFVNIESPLDEKLSVTRNFPNESSYCIEYYASPDERYLDIVSDSDEIARLNDSIEFSTTVFTENDDLEFYEDMKIKIKSKDFFTNCSKFYFHGELEDVSLFIDNNYDFLRDKEIILDDRVALDEENLKIIKEISAKFTGVKIRVEGNADLISVKDYELTMEGINHIVEKVEKYDFSSFEKLIYVYDLIRDRFYIREDETEKASVSRDLTSSLLGEKIVCLGFANIFKAVCDKLGIKNMVFTLTDGERGHARNLVYLVDEKYDIDGLYFFDPTFDCKKDENNKFLFSYKYFAKTYREITDFTGTNYSCENYEYFDFEKIGELEAEIPEDEIDTYKLLKLLTKTRINTILELLGKEKLNIMSTLTADDFMEIIYEISNKCAQSINSKEFIKALYQVRKQQYYEEPTKYLFDMDVLTCILVNSQFVVEVDDPIQRLLSNFYALRNCNVANAKKLVNDFLTENDLDKDIERVKLARTLRTICQQKNEEEKKLEKKMF